MPAATLTPQVFEVDSFDIAMHATTQGLTALQARLSGWLSTLSGPGRFVSYQTPATLKGKIDQVQHEAQRLTDSNTPAFHRRADLLTEYLRFYEALQREGKYQRSSSFLVLWDDDNRRALANQIGAAFETAARPVTALPSLFEGQYTLRSAPFWHLAPVGRPGGRLLWTILTGYECLPATWTFFKPHPPLLAFNFPLALSVDISKTYDRTDSVEAIERTIFAYRTHLASARSEDSRAVQRIKDCNEALSQINSNDALHLVQISIAVAAPSAALLRERARTIARELRAWVKLREESGVLLRRAVSFFSTAPTKQLDFPDTTWPLTSRELSLMFAPVGYRKLAGTRGILRGEAAGGQYPFFYDSWNDKYGRPEKRATHEAWVGVPGFGKSFYLNCLLSREYAENGVPFDLLEPMGHGQHIARAFGLDWFVLSARKTKLNPLDVAYPTLDEQKNHVIHLFETVMGRMLTGAQQANLERGLLGQALEEVYSGYKSLEAITPDLAPTVSTLCHILAGLGDTPRRKEIAHDLAEEIDSLCCGSGPFAAFLDGQTNLDLSFRGKATPRVFSFHEMSEDPTLLALAYTQVLAAIRRDSLADEQPRIIAVDEVYRLMRHPSLLDFLIEAAKTFRTRRKKLVVIDQQMSIFLAGKARLVFENCPIRVIFNQRQGLNVFYEDQAFQHYNQQHRELIGRLSRFQFMMDIQDEGLFLLNSRPSEAELDRLGMT